MSLLLLFLTRKTILKLFLLRRIYNHGEQQHENFL